MFFLSGCFRSVVFVTFLNLFYFTRRGCFWGWWKTILVQRQHFLWLARLGTDLELSFRLMTLRYSIRSLDYTSRYGLSPEKYSKLTKGIQAPIPNCNHSEGRKFTLAGQVCTGVHNVITAIPERSILQIMADTPSNLFFLVPSLNRTTNSWSRYYVNEKTSREAAIIKHSYTVGEFGLTRADQPYVLWKSVGKQLRNNLICRKRLKLGNNWGKDKLTKLGINSGKAREYTEIKLENQQN